MSFVFNVNVGIDIFPGPSGVAGIAASIRKILPRDGKSKLDNIILTDGDYPSNFTRAYSIALIKSIKKIEAHHKNAKINVFTDNKFLRKMILSPEKLKTITENKDLNSILYHVLRSNNVHVHSYIPDDSIYKIAQNARIHQHIKCGITEEELTHGRD